MGCGSDCKINRTRLCENSLPASDGSVCKKGMEEFGPGEGCNGGLCPGNIGFPTLECWGFY